MSLTDVQWVRYRIGDTGTTPHFDDDALQAYLDIEAGDRALAAAVALDAWATQLAASAHDVMLGDYRENTSAAAKAMHDMAKQIREDAESEPAFAVVEGHRGPWTFPWQDMVVNDLVRRQA